MINDQIQCIPLDLSLSATAVFSHFAELPYAMLLDSASTTHPNSRFDIIVAWPEQLLQAEQGNIILDGELCATGLDVLAVKLGGYSSNKAPEQLPFSGGWVGYISYDFGRYLERIPCSAAADIQLPELALGLYPDALIYDKQLSSWFYVAQPHVNRLAQFQAQLAYQPKHKTFALTKTWRANMTQQQYQTKFAQVQAYLKSGDCYQINLAQRFSAEFSGSPWLAYEKLRDTNTAPFSAYINLPQGQILSVSPERFIQVIDRTVETKPIKGTLPRGKTAQEDQALAEQLRLSAKDRAENVMIVDLLRNDLGKVAEPGTVQVPSLFAIESFPAVHHLVSTVTAQLAADKTAIDQLLAAFPGGSITGAPKIRAMEIIEELEPHRRSVYCGSIGYLSACGNMDTSITIRTLIAAQGKLYCWAGGGIVADSNVDAEYQETFHKVNKILPTLN
ncbi:aminodeoxychorismate synthase component I [Pseudoalteromonas fenneropenaei]|uniref:aminodeoxychorismate synthase n=1 Tax=Pseudoalteromonas fenneropenaei TaxID=1737459 RepID=A0ABV7CIC4_9GAMM